MVPRQLALRAKRIATNRIVSFVYGISRVTSVTDFACGTSRETDEADRGGGRTVLIDSFRPTRRHDENIGNYRNGTRRR